MSKKTILTALFASFALVGGVASVMTLAPATASAQASNAKEIVDNAKAQGLVGETAGGYLAVVTTAPRDVVNAMNEINIRRKSLYTNLARQQNVQVDEVAALSGEKTRALAKSGEKYLDNSGRWITIR